MPLRINAKNYFLTYAQAERIESKEHLLWHLRDLVPTPERWAIGEEEHADGGRHYHGQVQEKVCHSWGQASDYPEQRTADLYSR